MKKKRLRRVCDLSFLSLLVFRIISLRLCPSAGVFLAHRVSMGSGCLSLLTPDAATPESFTLSPSRGSSICCINLKPMKTAFSLIALIATIGLAHAGGFGGPPPFTNGSPLVSGVDGSYSGTLTAENTVGIVRFTYSNNIQTSDLTGNSYTIFSEGLVFGGPNQVTIADTAITGVLERDTDPAFSNTAMTGYFTATLEQNSSLGCFNGNGILQFYIEDVDNEGTYLNFFSKDVKVTGLRNSQSTSS
jgi:hypothetical protein